MRPNWPLASRAGRRAKADGAVHSAGTIPLESLRRGRAAVAFRWYDRHLGEIWSPGATASKHGPRIVGERPRRVSRRSPPYQHQLGQPRSVLDSADLPHGYCWASLPISANCMACERDRSCAAPGDSARPQVRAAAAHGQPARALWSYQQSSALVPTAKVSSLRRRHGERVTAAATVSRPTLTPMAHADGHRWF